MKKLDIKDLKKQLLSLTNTDKLNEFAASEVSEKYDEMVIPLPSF